MNGAEKPTWVRESTWADARNPAVVDQESFGPLGATPMFFEGMKHQASTDLGEMRCLPRATRKGLLSVVFPVGLPVSGKVTFFS